MRTVVLVLGVVVSLLGGGGMKEAAAQDVPPPAAQPGAILDVSRWVDTQTFTVNTRYHFVDAGTTGPDTNHAQAQEILRLRLKADRGGHVAVGLGASSGPSFTGSWNDTGLGTGTHRFHVSLRLLSLDLAPAHGVAVQVGSMQLARGESTEITSYDNDGYVMGERLSVRRPKELWFDEVSVSRGFLGDTTRPSVFDRIDRFHDFNYQQYLVARRVTSRVWSSADFTRLAHINTFRAAARVRAPELRIVDSVRYEQYVRFDHRTAVAGAAANRGTDTDAIYGFAVSGEKQITKPLLVSVGFADIDRQYGGLNADRFNRGRRLFTTLTYALSPVLAISTFVGHAIHNDYAVINNTRVDVILQYNVLAHLQRTHLLR